jgi:hypothetical protein
MRNACLGAVCEREVAQHRIAERLVDRAQRIR